MNEGLIATRYARALLEYAAEKGSDERLYGMMCTLAATWSAVPGLRSALENPLLGAEEKRALVATAAAAGDDETFARFVALVVEHRREEFLHSMALRYADLYRRSKGISRVELFSAVAMPEEALDRLREQIGQSTGGTVEFSSRIDPALEGGFVLRIDDLSLDASVAGQLRCIRRGFIEKNKRLV